MKESKLKKALLQIDKGMIRYMRAYKLRKTLRYTKNLAELRKHM
jgi:hypothetical protein